MKTLSQSMIQPRGYRKNTNYNASAPKYYTEKTNKRKVSSI